MVFIAGLALVLQGIGVIREVMASREQSKNEKEVRNQEDSESEATQK